MRRKLMNHWIVVLNCSKEPTLENESDEFISQSRCFSPCVFNEHASHWPKVDWHTHLTNRNQVDEFDGKCEPIRASIAVPLPWRLTSHIDLQSDPITDGDFSFFECLSHDSESVIELHFPQCSGTLQSTHASVFVIVVRCSWNSSSRRMCQCKLHLSSVSYMFSPVWPNIDFQEDFVLNI